jgi:hypothetical protein
VSDHLHDIFFTGLIHPQAGYWHLDRPLTLTEGGREIEVFFQNSVFNVRVTFSDGYRLGVDADRDAAWLNPIWYEVEARIRSVLDCLGFVLAASLEIEMTTGRADSVAIIGGHTALPAFSRVGGDRVDPEHLGAYLAAAQGNANLRHALADIIMALRLSSDTAFYCFRAIECLRQDFVQDGTRDKHASWNRLHAAMGTSLEEMQVLTGLATARRHGETPKISHDEKLALVRWTREVIGRYVESGAIPNV